jgi:hypothetical protein
MGIPGMSDAAARKTVGWDASPKSVRRRDLEVAVDAPPGAVTAAPGAPEPACPAEGDAAGRAGLEPQAAVARQTSREKA